MNLLSDRTTALGRVLAVGCKMKVRNTEPAKLLGQLKENKPR